MPDGGAVDGDLPSIDVLASDPLFHGVLVLVPTVRYDYGVLRSGDLSDLFRDGHLIYDSIVLYTIQYLV